MNREQWQQKRSDARTTGTPSAIDNTRFAKATATPGSPCKAAVTMRQRQIHDAIGCCEWAIVGPGTEDLPALSNNPE